MNIPTSAIEKAIEGGWSFFKTPVDLPMVENTKHEAVHVADIALDPTFWQALGKSLRGEIKTNTYVKRVHSGKPHLGSVSITRPNRYSFNWRKHAHEFYDLILSGKDAKAFWQELLS